MAKRQSGFFIPIGYFFLAGIIAVIVGIGFVVAHKNKKVEPTLAQQAGVSAQKTTASAAKVDNFYECFESDGRTYKPGKPNSCTVHGQTFSEPTKFTDDNVRGANKLPAGVRGQVFTEASKNFAKCSKENEAEENVPVTQVLSILGDDWAFIAMSCDDNSDEIFMKQTDGTWKMISRTNQKVTCALADQYQIPKELFLTSENGSDHDTACLKADGNEAQIPYTYKPSNTTD